MGIHIHDLPEDLDLGQLSTLRGGAFDSAAGIGLEGDAPIWVEPYDSSWIMCEDG